MPAPQNAPSNGNNNSGSTSPPAGKSEIISNPRDVKPAEASQKEQLSVESLSAKPAVQEGALGLVCTRSFPAIIGTADMMLKSSGVTLVGYEKTGSGYCTAVVRGGYADVKIAIEAGKKTAAQFEQYVSSMMLPRPWPNLDVVLPISTRFAGYAEGAGNFEANGAVGLIETRGFPAMVGASDAMMKCANVELITYETTGSGLCTAVVQGRIGDVTMAIEAGMNEAERIGELHAIMVIPRPLDDLMRAMPKPKRMAMEKPLPELAEKEAAAEPAIAQTEPAQIALPELEERELIPIEVQIPQESQKVESIDLPGSDNLNAERRPTQDTSPISSSDRSRELPQGGEETESD